LNVGSLILFRARPFNSSITKECLHLADQKSQGGIELNKVKLSKTGELYIPKTLIKILNIEVGDRLNIFIEGKKIVLTSKAGFENENKCTYNQKGTIHIPAEIRRISNIDTDVVFTITIDEKEKQVCLIPDLTG
jgi:bifunctional DNA-binding transcriptional regulator/antitoxin component of YhaV-PrlF toxin-antitoxin module